MLNNAEMPCYRDQHLSVSLRKYSKCLLSLLTGDLPAAGEVRTGWPVLTAEGLGYCKVPGPGSVLVC